jgi:hypothetical protein
MATSIANHAVSPGKAISRLAECYRRLEEAGLTYEDLQRPIDDAEFRKRLVQFWKLGHAPLSVAVADGYAITVDYTKSLADMIAAGKYNWMNRDITAANFPVTGKGLSTEQVGTVKLKIVLFHPNRDIESEDVVKELDQKGLCPATLPELLAYGARYRKTQHKFPILALGSSWVHPLGFRFVPRLQGNSRKRCLQLRGWDMCWHRDCRFAAVPASARATVGRRK